MGFNAVGIEKSRCSEHDYAIMSSRIADDSLSAEYFRRLRLHTRGTLCIMAGAALGLVLVMFLSGPVQLIVAFHLVIIVFAVGLFFSSKVWRCPSCSQSFKRAHRKCYCEHCGIQFSFTPPPTTPK
jgi:hypothetical protein